MFNERRLKVTEGNKLSYIHVSINMDTTVGWDMDLVRVPVHVYIFYVHVYMHVYLHIIQKV
jgi:hypothetical protein